MSDAAVFERLAGLAALLSDRAVADHAAIEAEDAALRGEIEATVGRFRDEVAAASASSAGYEARRALETYRLGAEAYVAQLEAKRDRLHPRLAATREAAKSAVGRKAAVDFLLREARAAERRKRDKREEDERAILIALKRAAAGRKGARK